MIQVSVNLMQQNTRYTTCPNSWVINFVFSKIFILYLCIITIWKIIIRERAGKKNWDQRKNPNWRVSSYFHQGWQSGKKSVDSDSEFKMHLHHFLHEINILKFKILCLEKIGIRIRDPALKLRIPDNLGKHRRIPDCHPWFSQ